MSSKPLDENDQLKAGILPDDVFEEAEPFIAPAPIVPNSADGGFPAGTVPPSAPAPIDLDAMHISRILPEGIARMKARSRKEEVPIPVPWEGLDRELGGGLWPGLTVLVGGTGVGRSQFGFNIAEYAAKRGTPILYIGLELGRVDTTARLLGLVSDTKWSRLALGEMDPATVDDLAAKHGPALADLPLHLEFGPPHGWRHDTLMPLGRAMRERYPEVAGADGRPVHGSRPFLLILDFLQIVGGDERELRQRIAKASYAGRALAREMDAAVVLISSTSRENYAQFAGEASPGKKKTASPPPGTGNPNRFVGTGKESGEVEFSADTVLAFVQEPWTDGKPPPNGTALHLAVAKNRARPTGTKGWVHLRFDGNRFTDAPPPSVVTSDADDTGAGNQGEADDEEYPF